MSIVAFIPARGGSERILGKNIRMLAGHPLLAYAIAGAKHSGIFDGIYVSTESKEIAEVARKYGAEVIDRPEGYSHPRYPDIGWFGHALGKIYNGILWNPGKMLFFILRPTNPFRMAGTIKRARDEWGNPQFLMSMRAVEPSRQHPGKMWRLIANYLRPYEGEVCFGGNTCDECTQNLPSVLVQNGCLQITTDEIYYKFGNYTGAAVMPFMTRGYEGFDLNTEDDWILAEALIERGLAKLEPIP